MDGYLVLLRLETYSEMPARYIFNLNGETLSLLRGDAVALVTSIPAKMRNCKVAFDQVVLKASCRSV